tara:strand:+ start:379 stop:960 length:582 start_codon:yes stop_codon:yes gene_type:complete
MRGFVYLIRNKDLYKIGITQNLEQRMKALKPDEILSTMQTENYEALEKQLHKKYSDVRIPQTEYFRLSFSQATECKELLESDTEILKSNISETANSPITSEGAFFSAPILIALPILFLGGFFELLIGDNFSWIEVYKIPTLIVTPLLGFIGLIMAGAEFFNTPKESEGPIGISLFLWSLIIFLSFYFYRGSTV